jgi:TPR repeat protein
MADDSTIPASDDGRELDRVEMLTYRSALLFLVRLRAVTGSYAIIAVVLLTTPAQGDTDRGPARGHVSVDVCTPATRCKELGDKSLRGTGVRSDDVKAAAYYEAGCNQRDRDCCLGLAVLLETGIGRPPKRDEAKALALFQAACDQGDLPSCRSVGAFYEQGSETPGVIPKDPVKAASIFQKTCDQGEGPSCLKLAVLYEKGRGVKKDKRRAAALRKQAARLGADPRE